MANIKKIPNPNIIVRKKERFIKDLNDGDRFRILKAYCKNVSYQEMSDDCGVSSRNIQHWVDKFTRAAIEGKETRVLMRGGAIDPALEIVSTSKGISTHFLSLLSDEGESILNESENIYVMEWVSSGNSNSALSLSKLDMEEDGTTISSKYLKQARGKHLRERPKVKAAIKREEQIMIDDMASSKDFIQRTLIQTVRRLQEDQSENKNRSNNLLKAVELLGKTIPSTFTETIRTEEVSPKDTLTLLAKKIQAAESQRAIEEVNEIEGGSYYVE